MNDLPIPGTREGEPAAGAQPSRARVRHDIFTPLNHIIGYSEMLLDDGTVPDSFRRDLERIRRSGRRLGVLVDKEFDASSADNRDVRQLLYDLRTPANGIIGYSELLAEEALQGSGEQLAADLGKIAKAAGEFIGLVELHFCQGRDAVFHPPGSARELPVSNADADRLEREFVSRHTEPLDQHPVHGTILIIDDDHQTREILSRRLTTTGHQVETVSDGVAGLERLKGEGSIDLVLVDMVMPGLSGVEVLARIKGDPDIAEIPVIVISALDDQDGIARCIELGAEDYLSKPFNTSVLRARVNTSLEKRRLRTAEKEHLDRIVLERRRSDELLLNVLPESIAARLKAGENRIADHFSNVSVLFADIAGFTPLSAKGDPVELVELLNAIFSLFDSLSDRHGLEKIKTIGDAYMVVSGLPEPADAPALAMGKFALDLDRAMREFNADRDVKLGLRIGIASGPVVAGIIGRRKFIYDLWGDTVNTASRMESHGRPGEIHVDPATYLRLKDESGFEFEARGSSEIKGKGAMETYFLRGTGSGD